MAGVSQWAQACVILQLCLSGVLPAASQTSRTYYDTLSVEPTATGSQIKKNFRKLAVKYHPDKNKSADAEKTFREIAEAYKVLSNEEKRRLYDRVGHDAFLRSEASGDPEEHEHDDDFYSSFGDFFHDFDDDPFMEEPYFHWSVHQDEEDEGAQYQHYSFEEPLFNMYFEGDNEEDNPQDTWYI